MTTKQEIIQELEQALGHLENARYLEQSGRDLLVESKAKTGNIKYTYELIAELILDLSAK